MTNTRKKKRPSAPPLPEKAPKKLYVSMVRRGPYAGDWRAFSKLKDAKECQEGLLPSDGGIILIYQPVLAS